jgi:adenosylcobinamide-GDP ribazoletransferase
LWGLSRSAMAAVVASQPYARGPEGMAGSLGRPRHPALIALSALASVGALMAWRPLPGLAVACGCLAAAALVTAVARRKLGGYTGDVLGAVAIVGETTGLVVAAARW